MEELTKKDILENKAIDLIPGIFSLSKDGTGFVKLSEPLKSAVRLQPQPETEGEPSHQDSEGEGFVRVRFRALSQVLIEDYWLDFRKEGVLKKAAALLKNQTVYADHKVSVHEWIGAVEDSFWDGETEPNGIDADLKIDSVENPRIARGLTMVPPAIHSASVTTFFKWSKSHPGLDDFWWLLGEEVDGEIVRIVVDSITQLAEISLVWQGADPFAKRKFTAETKEELKKFFNAAESISLSAKTADTASQEEGGVTMSEDTKNTEKVQELEKQLEELQKDHEKLETENAALQKEKEENADFVELGKSYKDELVAEIESLYRLLKGEAADDEFIEKMITNGSVESLQILRKDYRESLKDKLSLTCPHCGKEIKGIRSSLEQAPEEEKIDETDAEKHKVQ